MGRMADQLPDRRDRPVTYGLLAALVAPQTAARSARLSVWGGASLLILLIGAVEAASLDWAAVRDLPRDDRRRRQRDEREERFDETAQLATWLKITPAGEIVVLVDAMRSGASWPTPAARCAGPA